MACQWAAGGSAELHVWAGGFHGFQTIVPTAAVSRAGAQARETWVRRILSQRLRGLGLEARTDRLGNLIASLAGAAGAPSVMLFTHMDQLGFVVRKIEADGLIRVQGLSLD